MSRNGRKPKWVILHGTAGGSSAEGIARWFQNPDAEASTHHVIGLNGERVQCVKEEFAAWSNGDITDSDFDRHDSWWIENPNYSTISIEHVKPHDDNSDQLTPAQKVSSFELIEEICDRWNIQKRDADAAGGITGHFSMDPLNRSRCPGPYPFDELFDYLNRGFMLQLTDPFAQRYFKQDAGTWLCSNGFRVYGGILEFYRKILGSVRLPLSNEITDGAIKFQVFEAGVIVYDPNRAYDNPTSFYPCYLIKLDSTLMVNIMQRLVSNNETALLQKLKQVYNLVEPYKGVQT